MKEKVNIFSNIKERIMYFVENQPIKKGEFFDKIGVTSANFRGNAQKTPLNSNTIENIISIYPELDLYWLITGKGEMLRNVSIKKEEMGENAEIVALLKQQIEDLKADKERLYKLLESKEGNQKTA